MIYDKILCLYPGVDSGAVCFIIFLMRYYPVFDMTRNTVYGGTDYVR